MRGAQREAIESSLLALVGVVGVVVGVRSFAPPPVVPKPAPYVAAPPQGWPKMAEHADEVTRYVLNAKLDPAAHTIEGKGTITFKNVAKVPLSDLRLHLYLNGFKNDRTLFRRARVGGFRGDSGGAPGFVDVKKLAIAGGEDLWPKHEFVTHQGESPQDPLTKDSPAPFAGAPSDETDVRVPLPKPLMPGESLTLDLEFHDQLPEVSERTGYHGSFHFAGQWFPKLAKLEKDGWASFPFHHVAEFYSDFGSWDVTIDVPQDFVIGASGKGVESKVENGRRIERYTLSDAHDFAWTAWDRFVTRERTLEGIAVKALGPPGYDDAIERELLALEHAIRDKNARFGAYPYPVLTMVHPPSGADEAGGMEYPTLITTGGSWLPWNGGHDVEFVTVHEFGHQWFYGLVATNEVEWPAGDEGFNSFADELAMNTLFVPGSAVAFGPLAVDTELFMRRGVFGPYEEPIFQPAYKFASGRSYGARVYGGTASALVTLRRVFGPSFDTAMGVWARTQRFKHPQPEEFFPIVREFAGAECELAARALLTSSIGYEVYVDQIASEKAKLPEGWFEGAGGREKKNGGAGEGWANAAWIGRRGMLDIPVDVELVFEDGSRARRTIRFGPPPVVEPPKSQIDLGAIALGLTAETPRNPGSTWVRIDADGPKRLVSVIVDPDLKILVDKDRLDNFASIPSKKGGAPVTRERAIAWIGTLLREVGP